MTVSVVKNLLIKAAQTKQGSEAMHFTQAAINAAQALNLAQIADDLFSEPMLGQKMGYGSAVAREDALAAREELARMGVDPYGEVNDGYTKANIAGGFGIPQAKDYPRTGLGSSTSR